MVRAAGEAGVLANAAVTDSQKQLDSQIGLAVDLAHGRSGGSASAHGEDLVCLTERLNAAMRQ